MLSKWLASAAAARPPDVCVCCGRDEWSMPMMMQRRLPRCKMAWGGCKVAWRGRGGRKWKGCRRCSRITPGRTTAGAAHLQSHERHSASSHILSRRHFPPKTRALRPPATTRHPRSRDTTLFMLKMQTKIAVRPQHIAPPPCCPAYLLLSKHRCGCRWETQSGEMRDTSARPLQRWGRGEARTCNCLSMTKPCVAPSCRRAPDAAGM